MRSFVVEWVFPFVGCDASGASKKRCKHFTFGPEEGSEGITLTFELWISEGGTKEIGRGLGTILRVVA